MWVRAHHDPPQGNTPAPGQLTQMGGTYRLATVFFETGSTLLTDLGNLKRDKI